VTSRLLPTSASSAISEALLLIDEPGSGLPAPVPGFGPAAPQTLCSTPLQGCTEFVALNGTTPVAVGTPTGTTAGPNVFQGIVNGNSVTFFGVPVLAPGTTFSRVFRITNVRVNANPLAGGSASGASPVQASIAISGATSLLISNPNPTVGFVQNGLTTSVSGTGSFNQCSTQTRSAATTLRFAENFGTAFKTRVSAASNTAYAGQINNPVQNVPGGIYNSESNFVLPAATGNNGGVAGLADFGTRLKAVFNNIPAGARIFVSTANVLNGITAFPAPAVIGGSTANTATTGYAQLINGETSSAGNAGNGFFPAVTATDNGPNNGNVPVAEVAITNGTGTAVWEVVNTNPNTLETLQFAVFISYSASTATNSPTPGTSTVNLSFAPTPPAFTAAAGAAASSSLTIPRFIPDPGAARNILTVNICRTILLYPYVTNQAGFDTGLAIANTTVDPFGTGAQSGTCRLNWYGGTTSAPTTSPAATTTDAIGAGVTYVNTAQALVPNFQGYMIAVCNFQFAHGFAFISDVGARNLAMGYLAVVLNDPGTGSRSNANTTTSENGAH